MSYSKKKTALQELLDDYRELDKQWKEFDKCKPPLRECPPSLEEFFKKKYAVGFIYKE